VNALQLNTTGTGNVAMGFNALSKNSVGGGNIAIGAHAGELISGDSNIDIGNPGVAGESRVLRIGAPGEQRKAFVAGIWGSPVAHGLEVVVNSNGQLGVEHSSERYKTDISPLQTSPDKLGELQPVSFHYKTDPTGELHYGLIAEDVAKVYPDLVVRDDQGNIEGVRYGELAPILLKEVQEQQQVLRTQAALLQELRQQVADLQETANSLQGGSAKLKGFD